MTDIRKWLEQASEPCGNDACIGEWAVVHGRALLDEIERLTAERDALRAENAAMLDILRPFFPLIVPPGCDVWEMVKAAVSDLRNRLADEGPVRTDVWVGGRSDGEVRL